MKRFKIINKLYFLIGLSICLSIAGCRKQNEWLNVKSSKGAVVPKTANDFQALLNNTIVLNRNYSNDGLVGSDNFYFTEIGYNSAQEQTRNLYVWNKSIEDSWLTYVWTNSFSIVAIANVVLEGLNTHESQSNKEKDIMGQALFFRAISNYNLTQLFCNAYTDHAGTDLGIPIRLTSDVNVVVRRSSLKTTYQQIISDANAAADLLAATQPYLQRPSKPAAYALLAKTYLNMGDYENALLYANKCLELHPQLLNYNDATIASAATDYRFPMMGKGNPEILFYAQSNSSEAVSPATWASGVVADELYQLYSDHDLRKTLYYVEENGEVKYRGSYTGDEQNFSGLATNEIYLIRAEANARMSNLAAVTGDLNTLFYNRYLPGTVPAFSLANREEALKLVLCERRKELPFVTNLRWEDLKRLNLDPKLQKIVTRTVAGITYTLPPGDKRYVLPIPLTEVQLSQIQQNER